MPPGTENEDDDIIDLLPGLTVKERNVYRAMTRPSEDEALTFADIRRRFRLSMLTIGSIMARVRRKLEIFKKTRPGSMLCTAPPLDAASPRDGVGLQHTSDMLYLALLLEGAMRTGWIEDSIGNDGHRVYRPTPKPEVPATNERRYMKARTLKRLVLQHPFWRMRRLRHMPNDHRIKMPRGLVLKHPVKKGSDRLLSGPWFDHFHSWAECSDLVVPAGQLLCPVCGPTDLIAVSVRSPAATWQALCGRAYELDCCAGCLGVFGQTLGLMN